MGIYKSPTSMGTSFKIPLGYFTVHLPIVRTWWWISFHLGPPFSKGRRALNLQDPKSCKIHSIDTFLIRQGIEKLPGYLCLVGSLFWIVAPHSSVNIAFYALLAFFY